MVALVFPLHIISELAIGWAGVLHFFFSACPKMGGLWVVGGVTGEIDRNSGGDKDAV